MALCWQWLTTVGTMNGIVLALAHHRGDHEWHCVEPWASKTTVIQKFHRGDHEWPLCCQWLTTVGTMNGIVLALAHHRGDHEWHCVGIGSPLWGP